MRRPFPTVAGIALALTAFWLTACAQDREAPQTAYQSQVLNNVLGQEYDLKATYVAGQKRHYRLWMTLESLDPWGNLQGRHQWRGDFEREVESVDTTGKAEEKITWKNVGFRSWDIAKGKYGAHQEIPWAENFSYSFSAEDAYDDIKWDYAGVPRDMAGVVFRAGFQVSAHFEFDFMRSSRHASIEKLRRVGDLLPHPPEEGQEFSLSFPSLMENSHLKRENVEVGFLGLTQVAGEPCAIIDYRQGPQRFWWDTRNSQQPAFAGENVTAWHTEMTAWQHGQFVVRLKDGSLVHGEFTERQMSKLTPQGGGEPAPSYGRGIWSIREITAEDYAEGLEGWEQEGSPTPRFRPAP
jgi:hypothetical protein